MILGLLPPELIQATVYDSKSGFVKSNNKCSVGYLEVFLPDPSDGHWKWAIVGSKVVRSFPYQWAATKSEARLLELMFEEAKGAFE